MSVSWKNQIWSENFYESFNFFWEEKEEEGAVLDFKHFVSEKIGFSVEGIAFSDIFTWFFF